MKNIKVFIYASIFILLDQIVKFICVIKLKPLGSIKIIKDFFYLTYVENKGAAFGILHGAIWFFVIMALVATSVCIYYLYKIPNDKYMLLSKISLTFIISGAFGNMLDRLFRGFVVDMFHFILFGKDFAVFNLADIFVCVGAFLMCVSILLGEKEVKKFGKL